MSTQDAIAKARAQWARARDLAVGGGAAATAASTATPLSLPPAVLTTTGTPGLKNMSFGALASMAAAQRGLGLGLPAATPSSSAIVSLPPMPALPAATPASSAQPVALPVSIPLPAATSTPSSTAATPLALPPLPVMPLPVQAQSVPMPVPMPVAVPVATPAATPTPIPTPLPVSPTPSPAPTSASASAPATSTPTGTATTSTPLTSSFSGGLRMFPNRQPTTVPTGRSALTLSRVIQETATIDVVEKERYAADVKKTLVVKNVPQNVSSTQIAGLFNVPHGIRSIKWYAKGKVKNALVEFVEAGEGPQDKIDNLVNIEGNWLSVEPATISITQAQQLEYDYELRRQREAQTILRMSASSTGTGSAPIPEPTPEENESVAYWKARALAAEASVAALERELSLRRLAAGETGLRQSAVHVPPQPIPTTATKPPMSTETVSSPETGTIPSPQADEWREKFKQRVAEGVLAPSPEEGETETYLCPICFTDVPLNELFVLDTCFHRYCTQCMQEYLTTNIFSGVTQLKCPNPSCKEDVTRQEVKSVVDRRTYDKFEEFELKAVLNTIPNLRWCPQPNCTNAVIVTGGLMARCNNLRCRFTFCIKCRDEWHADISCEQYQKWKVDNSSADSRYKDWIKEHSKPCPRCQTQIEKNGGCNHMTCKHCTYEFCWLCMGKTDSNHYSTGPCAGKQFT
ncbi:E3 ubiquitin-protein ligase RNF19A [Pelomyxa schiedti]|nr:E3 ubiquitin-protein ligase RNF19A [Pelomyxa schiedti]